MSKQINKLVKDLESFGYRVTLSPRLALGLPCFHCGQTLEQCKLKRKCCRKCKGKASHL